ncbi:MAG: respiratory nitrate reductase subunit gamma [Candidatus Adiutricales bacterium]
MTLSLLIFGFGLFSLILFWFRAARIRENESGLAKKIFRGTRTVTGVLFSRKIILIFKTLWVDVLLNRRFFKLAPGRWLIHGLIFYPFLFRITWGLAALICSAIAPQWSVTRIIVDQNHPLTALLFDLTGILIIMGALGAIARRLFRKSIKIPDLPPPDWLAMGLLGLLLINGFMLEGVRMAMSGIGFPGSTKSAFLGMAISQAATGSRELSSAYVEFWYFHTLVAAVFIAYLPFSRFRHIFMAPLFLIMKTVLKKET